MKRLLILALLIPLIDGKPAAASGIADLSSLYDRPTLQGAVERYRMQTGKILDQVIAPALLPEDRRALGGVQMIYPMPGEDPLAGAAFGYYSTAASGTGKVVFPVLSLKFLEDLCTSYAWLQVNGYSLETISDYVAMLKYNRNLRNPPSPLLTLGIPANASAQKEVEELARGHFVTARAFILAHELGHLRFGHRGSSIAAEKQADAFAVDVMQRAGLPPLGIMVFFMADAQMADYPPGPDATHPLSADRLRVLAARLTDRVLAARIGALAEFLADPEIQTSIIAVGNATSPSNLAPRRPGAPATLRAPATTNQPFDGRFIGQFTQHSDPNNPARIDVVLRRTGNGATGEYAFGLGVGRIVDATISGDMLNFNWEWANSNGRGLLRATEGGAGFDGSWGYRDSRTDGGRWTARRAQ